MKVKQYGNTVIFDLGGSYINSAMINNNISSEVYNIILTNANCNDVLNLPNQIKEISFKDSSIDDMYIKGVNLSSVSSFNSNIDELHINSKKQISLCLSETNINKVAKAYSNISNLFMSKSSICLLESTIISKFKSDIASRIGIVDSLSSPIDIGKIAEYSSHSKPFIYDGTDDIGHLLGCYCYYDLITKKPIYTNAHGRDVSSDKLLDTSRLGFLTNVIPYMV